MYCNDKGDGHSICCHVTVSVPAFLSEVIKETVF